MNPPQPSFDHIWAMSDGIGTFEHADHTTPRVGEGYCTDDMARVLVAACREPVVTETVAALTLLSYRFVVEAQRSDGTIRNRRSADGRWQDRGGVDDCWGRAMWALGTAARSAPQRWMRDGAAAAFACGTQQRSRWPRAMSFAALGAAELLTVEPGDDGATALLADAVATIGRPALDPVWPWPEPRLTYANALLPEALIAAGTALGRPDVLDDGLELLRWLLARETKAGHLSLTGAQGAGPTDRMPSFDQQPIEAAALADACVRARAATADRWWDLGLAQAVGWFLGANDVGVPVCDPDRGAAFDGLEPGGVNRNQGTESTLALITTLQHARALVGVG